LCVAVAAYQKADGNENFTLKYFTYGAKVIFVVTKR
jgi:hypothetical protein